MPTLSAERPGRKAGPRPEAHPNYFQGREVAERYSRVRPYFHGEVAERVRQVAGVERFARVLDVGCGSGQSALALAEVADEVIAIDPSAAMLATAEARPNVQYRLGVAEQLEFADGRFDLVSVGSALHWFDQPRFYGECRRVLAERGLLAAYNDHFTAHMVGSVECKRWMRTRFAKRYPPPRRGMRDMDEACAAGCGFRILHRGCFDHVVRFSRQELIAYLLTRSNTLAALAKGRESESAMLEWLNRELSLIVADRGEFIFKCNFWVLQPE